MNAPVKPSKLIKGATGDWEMVIGLEVHAQVTSNSKLFSGASTEFGGEPNSHVSLVDAAMPGMLPVINAVCIRQAVRTGLGLKAEINLRSVFDRKNYFYPDLPQGYQISQYKSPIVGEGEVIVDLADGDSIAVAIERLHLEQDAGKSLHDQNPAMSLVDLNRSGVALMEIVSKPDMRSSEQARAYVTKLRAILRYLGTCDGDMEKGSLRADVNVSVRKPGAPLGTRCEIKNVNSIRFIGQAIDYEARRQIGILEDGGSIEQETRLFDPDKGETRSMRSKEEAHDYRYFPDPDLLPLEFTQAYVDELKADLPELPDQKKSRFIGDFGLTPYDASVLVGEHESADFYEAVLAALANRTRDGKLAANWVINELFGRLNKEGEGIAASPVSAAQLGTIVDLIGEGTISGKIAKDLFEIVWQEGGDPRALVEARGMRQVTDIGAIEKAVDEIIAANPDKVAQARAKPQLVGWFVGQVMKSSGGKANPQSVNDLLKVKLGI
jgi:aspartyl-tRNA(Asn)/glutamyl-tRNA(Gln) amidotransferase subunit B